MRKRLVAQHVRAARAGQLHPRRSVELHIILTKDSHYGLDLQVDLQAFEDVLIFYRGATTITERRRDIRKAYIGWSEVKMPVFQRLFILFKLKPFDARVQEVMREQKIDRKRPRGIVKRLRGCCRITSSSDYVYIKLFKNMPRSDVEMIFPNTKVRFRLFDKIKFGVTAGSGLGMGVVGTVARSRCLANPYTLAMALVGPWRRRRSAGHQFHQPAQPLHGGDGAQPLFPLHGRQPRRDDAAGRPRGRGGHQGGDAALQRAGKRPSNIRDLEDVDKEIEQYLARDLRRRCGLRRRGCARAG